ncbi:DUF5129 domain-containing protein [Paeniglutamicibacter sp. ZC-3]|uniref:DUF5129 domain-containing protein n=1 Tax=Paeniglutamicibacter sp. ZC-3 TaxID=2986919 RepID=UPI0021F6EEC6|nr:DUF5129 domain-containing protein [Paeniglutamicibacter sp. ZC-3]MCV9993515.1 DUF5129 domain-containing protein [Paeniglutamicibacter sp. ZC-3]
MSQPLITARRKPSFGVPWVALLLGLGTMLFAVTGFNAVTARPTAPVKIVVQGELRLNISQETVDAVLTEPILAWKPLNILVTDRLLSYDELQGRVDPGANVILTTAIVDDALNSERKERFNGAGIHPADADRDVNTANRFDIHNAYMDNVGLGHGPAAVAAAAQRAAEVLDDGRIRTPEFWVAGTALGLLLTVLAFGLSLPRRRRRVALYRRLAAAQLQLAGVVLELEALEVTFRSTDPDRRPPAFAATWRQIRESSLAMARSEESVIDAVDNPRTSLRPRTAAMVVAFETKARRLVASADALMGAGSVLGGLEGSARTFDKLAAPMAFATRELLARLAAAPTGTVAPQRVRRMEKALVALLGAGAKNHHATAALAAWKKAEHELERSITSVNRTLRRHRRGRVKTRPRPGEDFTSLRVGLGLPAHGSNRILEVLDAANAAASALNGPPAGSGEGREQPVSGDRRRFRLPRPGRRAVWITAAIAGALFSLGAAALVTESVMDRPRWALTGTETLRSLTLDGDTQGLTEADIRPYLEDKFTEPLDITVAVRDAGEYLKMVDSVVPAGQPSVPELDPVAFVDALWRVKSELPELLDATTGELLPGNAIIPVWVFEDNTAASPVPITSALGTGDINRLGDGTWEYGSFYASTFRASTVATEIEALSRGLQTNGYVKPDINEPLLYWLLASTFALALLTFAQLLVFAGSMSMRLGAFGRNASRLRRIRRDLQDLALRLDDSRLNTVAVLGAGSSTDGAEAGQRIFERALAMAWRMADGLDARPLSQRLGADYPRQIDQLENLVSTLGIRDADAARRTRELLEASRPQRATSR